MKEITILSGKGGTGKTSLSAAFASVSKGAVLCDADVDAPNLHLILQPETRQKEVFEGAYIASIDPETCKSCGLCETLCRFNAIGHTSEGTYVIDPLSCEGCRLCERECPVGAIHSERSKRNFSFISATRFGSFVHAAMGPGEENSGKLVADLRNKAKEIARTEKAAYLITDGPPGIGCPAISTITGTDTVVIITEPSVSGLHDAERLVELVKKFRIPVYAIINKADIHLAMANQLEAYFKNEGIPVLVRLNFDDLFTRAMKHGQSVIEFDPESETSHKIRKAWKDVSG